MYPYADNIKIYLNIDSPNSCNLLQFEIDIIYSWLKCLELTLNLEKYHIISFSRSYTPVLHQYFINNCS